MESEFRFLDFSTAKFKKKFRPESLEPKMELEFRFQWESPKSEPKIGIPNLAQSWGTSNGTFITDMVGDIELSFLECSASKKVCLQPDIVEYSPGDQAPMYDLIIGKQTMHDLGVVLDFQEKTITIDKNPPTLEEHCRSATQT